MGMLEFGLGLSGQAINNPAKPMNPPWIFESLPQKAKAVRVPEVKLEVIAYDPWGISFGITNQRVYQSRAHLLAFSGLQSPLWLTRFLCAPIQEGQCVSSLKFGVVSFL